MKLLHYIKEHKNHINRFIVLCPCVGTILQNTYKIIQNSIILQDNVNYTIIPSQLKLIRSSNHWQCSFLWDYQEVLIYYSSWYCIEISKPHITLKFSQNIFSADTLFVKFVVIEPVWFFKLETFDFLAHDLR